jgi:hypothetical protein
VLAVATAILLPGVARAQGVTLGPKEYDAKYAPIQDVSLGDLIAGSYAGKGVRVHGVMDEPFVLTDGPVHLNMSAVSAIVPDFANDVRLFLGQEMEVTGVFRDNESAGSPSEEFSILVWRYDGPSERRQKGLKAFPESLEPLVLYPAKHEGDNVRVWGEFRGRNLFGDLPGGAGPGLYDFVIKNNLFSVWVTGHEPRGSGFELDPNSKTDTGRWVEVVGKSASKNGVVYITASQLKLVAAPRPSPPAH